MASDAQVQSRRSNMDFCFVFMFQKYCQTLVIKTSLGNVLTLFTLIYPYVQQKLFTVHLPKRKQSINKIYITDYVTIIAKLALMNSMFYLCSIIIIKKTCAEGNMQANAFALPSCLWNKYLLGHGSRTYIQKTMSREFRTPILV